MQNLPSLFATCPIVWLVLFAYLFVVAAQVRAVRRDLDELKERVAAPPAPVTLGGSGGPAPRVEGGSPHA